ncbi:PDC sensor domain-containing protein [Leucothrix pacifica]|uniref:PDC sensor domain-containing protein n=1 Tax=Leucothrix pacifica TaxID=1247513 RepID=UPI0015E83C87|nr:hypothetical protein [Leucothrix pacifica]
MPNTLKHSIHAQRVILKDLLANELNHHAQFIPPLMDDIDLLDKHLRYIFNSLDHSKYVYVLDDKGIQLSSTINRFGADSEAIKRDRSQRPYMQHMYDESINFNLSQAYISRNKKRPSVTATQTIRNKDGQRLGYLGVDFDLRELPHSDVIYEEPSQWRQIKGDPAIRQGLFTQERVESLMDKHIDHVLSVHEALIVDQGVHHIQTHFSSSRSTIWHTDDPYVYRLLTMDELSNTNICLAYPRRQYFDRATVPKELVGKILRQFKALRFADETIYLRSASFNIVNGKVGLNFSCDGTHYLNYDEFLDKGLEFWFGGAAFPQATMNADLDTHKLDEIVETLALEGCMKVNKLLHSMEREETVESLASLTLQERDYVYSELKSVMDVYECQACDI